MSCLIVTQMLRLGRLIFCNMYMLKHNHSSASGGKQYDKNHIAEQIALDVVVPQLRLDQMPHIPVFESAGWNGFE